MTDHTQISDNFVVWIEQYQQLVVRGVRSDTVVHKIELHLQKLYEY